MHLKVFFAAMISPNYTNTDFNICLCAIYLHEIFAPNDDKNLCRLLVAGCLKNLPWIEQFMTRFVIIITNIVIIVITIIVITIIAITIMAITILSYMFTRFAALPQVAAYLSRPTYRSFSFSHSSIVIFSFSL